MAVLRSLGLLLFTALTGVAIVLAGGGLAFLQHPVAVCYLALWCLWWFVIALGRRRGERSAYDRSQRLILAGGVVALVALILLPPWEYSHLAGPLPRDGLLAWVGLAVFAAGVGLQAAALWALRGMYTTRLGIQPGHRLVTGGPYRWLRHPGYLSNLLCLAGMGLSLSSLAGLGLTLGVVPLILLRVRSEEAMLATEFGEDYRAYQRRTWRLMPFVF